MSSPSDLRSGVSSLATLAGRDLRLVWKSVTSAAEARVALMDVLPGLVEAYGAAAATFAADWYDEARDSAGVAGRFRAIPAAIPDPGVAGLIGWAESEAKTLETMLPLVEGGLQKRIANASRGTVIGSSAADPKALGWKRIGAGACAFCRMLIERNHLYTEATADFGSHDHCNCQAIADFVGADPIDVKAYVQSERRTTDADRSRVREWLRTH